jgi:hypothetical protein
MKAELGRSESTGNCLGSGGVSSSVRFGDARNCRTSATLLTFLAYCLQQFLLGAFEFLAPVLQLDRVNCIHAAMIERLEAWLSVALRAFWSPIEASQRVEREAPHAGR